MELQVLKDNSIHVFGNCKPPRNKAQKVLLEYINECMNLNASIDDDKLIGIYLENVKTEKGRWVTSYLKKAYSTYGEAKINYKEAVLCWDRFYREQAYELWTKDCWEVEEGCRTWFQRCLGSFVKNGHLIVIPKGYVLNKIEESTK